jgi:hypothetical protein
MGLFEGTVPNVSVSIYCYNEDNCNIWLSCLTTLLGFSLNASSVYNKPERNKYLSLIDQLSYCNKNCFAN